MGNLSIFSLRFDFSVDCTSPISNSLFVSGFAEGEVGDLGVSISQQRRNCKSCIKFGFVFSFPLSRKGIVFLLVNCPRDLSNCLLCRSKTNNDPFFDRLSEMYMGLCSTMKSEFLKVELR